MAELMLYLGLLSYVVTIIGFIVLIYYLSKIAKALLKLSDTTKNDKN